MSAPIPARTVNLDEVGQLVDQLERDLAKARAGGGKCRYIARRGRAITSGT